MAHGHTDKQLQGQAAVKVGEQAVCRCLASVKPSAVLSRVHSSQFDCRCFTFAKVLNCHICIIYNICIHKTQRTVVYISLCVTDIYVSCSECMVLSCITVCLSQVCLFVLLWPYFWLGHRPNVCGLKWFYCCGLDLLCGLETDDLLLQTLLSPFLVKTGLIWLRSPERTWLQPYLYKTWRRNKMVRLFSQPEKNTRNALTWVSLGRF